MAAAMAVVHLPHHDPFVSMAPGQPSFEMALVYLGIALVLLLVGPGRFSLDYLLFGRTDTGEAAEAGATSRRLGDHALS
jgi:putative oxidoreductase